MVSEHAEKTILGPEKTHIQGSTNMIIQPSQYSVHVAVNVPRDDKIKSCVCNHVHQIVLADKDANVVGQQM